MIKSPNDIWYVKPSSRGNEIYMLGLFESYVYSKPPYWGVSNTTGCHCKTIIPHQMHPNSQIFWLYSMHPSIQYSPHVWYHLKLDILNSYRLNWLNHLNPPNPKIKSLKSPNIARKISLNPQQTTNLSTFSPRKSAESPLFDTSSSVSPPAPQPAIRPPTWRLKGWGRLRLPRPPRWHGGCWWRGQHSPHCPWLLVVLISWCSTTFTVCGDIWW